MTNEHLIPINPSEPIENTIRFFNTMSGDNVEVLRISKDGITANPSVPVDEVARAVLRAVDGYLKQMTQRTWVGLTDDEIDQGLLRSDYAFKTAEAWRAGVVFAMTKLKEKNT